MPVHENMHTDPGNHKWFPDGSVPVFVVEPHRGFSGVEPECEYRVSLLKKLFSLSQ